MANVMIRRANVVLEIPDDEAVISKYLSNGYDVIDSSGTVVKKSTHGKGEDELRAELEELKRQNDKLIAENKALKGKLDALVADIEEDTDVPEEPPKKKRTSKKA